MTPPGMHQEIKFEEAIEAQLLAEGGWIQGDPEDFDRELAIDRRQLFAWLVPHPGSSFRVC